MTPDELAAEVGRMKHAAILVVQRHAAIRAPDVSLALVASLCAALGDISVDEAFAALDRLQQEARGRA